MRHSFYRDIHKAIRLMLGELTIAVGQTDFTERESFARLLPKVDEAFGLLAGHAHHENAFIGPLLAERRPDVARAIETAHHDQDEQLATLRSALLAIDCRGADATARGHAFVLELSRLVAELWSHMADEEEIVMPALWATCDDATLGEVHQRLVASIPPPEMIATMRFMIPAMNHAERVQFFRGLSAGAPPPVVSALLDVARGTLPPAELARLEDALDPPSQRAA